MKDNLYKKETDNFLKAIAYYICNKTSFSGLEVGKFSLPAFERNFTFNNINKFPIYFELLKDVKITNIDYSILLEDKEKTFIYLDPPYELINTANVLYGENGDLHRNFDHNVFFEKIKETNNKFCISYNSDDFIKQRYKDFNIQELEFMYISNTGKNKKGRKINEVLITNY